MLENMPEPTSQGGCRQGTKTQRRPDLDGEAITGTGKVAKHGHK
jgi:hypothetical protein